MTVAIRDGVEVSEESLSELCRRYSVRSLELFGVTLDADVTRSDPAPDSTMFEASVFTSKKLRKSFETMREQVVE